MLQNLQSATALEASALSITLNKGRTGETSLSHGCFVPVSTPPGQCHKYVSVMSLRLSPISVLSQPGHSNSLTLSQGCHTHGTVTFRDVFETPVRQMFTPLLCDLTLSSLLRLVISSQSVSHSSHGEQAAILVSLGLTTA